MKDPRAQLGLEDFSEWLHLYVKAEMIVRHSDLIDETVNLKKSNKTEGGN